MSTPPENEEKEEYFCEDEDANTPMTCATQTLDVLALHLPPDKLLPPLVIFFNFLIFIIIVSSKVLCFVLQSVIHFYLAYPLGK